jgi:D-sedoheptulose 7-phosphate isomerase
VSAGGLEALYPFLYADATARPPEDLTHVRESTREKAHEIVALRRSLVDRHAQRLLACAATLAERLRAGARVYTFGNGGSSTDAQDLAQLFLHPPTGRPLPALALTQDSAVLTALANDVGFDVVFARQLAALGRPGDIAVGLSTSGGSRNALAAFDEAARRGLTTVGLCGYDGGRMAELSSIDYLFVVPSPSVHRVQEAQTTLYHVLWELTQQRLTG